MQPESQPPAPAVVAVIVTCDPGSWFEHVLSSFAAQDYPNLSILILDAGSVSDPTPTVAKILPGAFVRRLERRVGYGTAANEVLSMVEGASHLLLCHDDVALAPDAIRLLVEEAFRSNAGIATPKFVQWDAPEHLLAVGATTDKVGVWRDLVEPGEMDQEQHDVVREVMIAPGGATLMRADLFEALGGYDPVVDQFGEDVDISWRARVAGARVIVVPAARVAHLQATRRGERAGWGTDEARERAHRRTETNRIRTLLACSRWYDLFWVVPLAFSWVLSEALVAAGRGRPAQGWALTRSFLAAFGRPAALWRTRRRIQSRRGASDGSIRRLQARGNTRFRAFLRSQVDEVWEGIPHPALGGRLGHTVFEDPDEDTAVPAPVVVPAPGRTGSRTDALIVVALIVLVVFGSRNLFGHELPAVGQLPHTAGSWSDLRRSWWTAWQPGGLGVAAPSSPAIGLLAVLATVLFGAVGTLQHVVVLGPLVIGPIGAYRAARWWGSRRGQVVALVAYAIVPLPYDALARGHWGGLVAFGAAPWIVGIIARLSGQVPFPPSRLTRIGPRLAGGAVLIAVVASVAPSFLYVVPVIGLALLAGSALTGRPGPGVRMVGVSVAAALGGFVLLLPWSATILGNGVATFGPSLGATGRLGFGAVVRFDTGPFGGGWLVVALLVAAALPLFIGRGWRLEWATRLWLVVLALIAVTWAGSRGWFPAFPPDVALAPAAAALAASAALGVAAFELDLPGYRFGWRQVAATTAGVALAVASLPLIMASGGGRWRMPSSDANSILAFLPSTQAGDYRVLWVGAPDALPLAGWQLHPGIAYATSEDGVPDLSDLWVPGSKGATPELASDLSLVEGRLTTKLGHLLAPASIRYIVIPDSTGPTGSGGRPVEIPTLLLSGLGLQTDLQSVDVGDPDYSVYQNSAWAPEGAVLSPAAAAVAAEDRDSSRRALQELPLSASAPVLTGGGPSSARGTVPAGSSVFVGASRSSGWRLEVAGSSIRPAPAFGWAMAFPVPNSAATASATASLPARLAYRASFWIRFAQWAEIGLWVAALVWLLVDAERRRRNPDLVELVDPEWFVPMAPAVSSSRTKRDDEGSSPFSGSADFDSLTGGEVWSDV